MTADEKPWVPITELYRIAREAAEARAELTAQYDDMILGMTDGTVWTAQEIAQYRGMMAADRELFQNYLDQGQRWQAAGALSPYKQAILKKLLADTAAALTHVERLAQIIPALPTTGQAPQAHPERRSARGKEEQS